MVKLLFQMLLSIMLVGLSYFGNQDYLLYNLFFIILLNTLYKNYLSYLLIIPCFFINQQFFFLSLGFCVLGLFISKIINKKLYLNLSLLTITLGFMTSFLFIYKIDVKIFVLLFIISSLIISLNLFEYKKDLNLCNELLLLVITIINTIYINNYLFLLVFITSLFSVYFINKKNYLIITSFFCCAYAVYKTNNYIFLTMQLSSYFSLFVFPKKKEDNNNQIEFLLEDINQNVTSFCNFMTSFSNKNYTNNYNEKLSTAIKILIQNYCAKCQNRNFCYSDKKMQTYVFLKRILTDSEEKKDIGPNGYFSCYLFPDLSKEADYLKQKYELSQKQNTNQFKIDTICTSIQNYFLSMFERINPQIIYLINFKKHCDNLGFSLEKYEQKITSVTMFEISFYYLNSASLERIRYLLKEYFSKFRVEITEKNNFFKICPNKQYKIIYDSATLSHDNYHLSGDNFLFKNITDSVFVCALSDGMGSGYNAYNLSKEALNMVDQITNCQIDFDTSLEILNNFFKSKEASDDYATLDFLNINLHNGQINLYKLGSSTTYIIRDNTVVPIYNNNLPFGINDLVTKEQYNLVDNDLIILVSDGVNDYISEDQLTDYIKKLQNETPHKIVYEILQKIYYDNNNQIKDDMSCVAIRVQKIIS